MGDCDSHLGRVLPRKSACCESPPLHRHDLQPLDQRILPVVVRHDVGGVAGVDFAFQGLVLLSSGFVVAEVRAEGQVALDAGGAGFVDVDVVTAKTFVVAGEEAAAGEAVFAPGAVAGGLELGGQVVDGGEAADEGEDVDDGLGGEARDGGAAEVVDFDELVRQERPEARGLPLEGGRPVGGVFGEGVAAFGGHGGIVTGGRAGG